jgi:hypothetical protein
MGKLFLHQDVAVVKIVKQPSSACGRKPEQCKHDQLWAPLVGRWPLGKP